MHFSKIFVSAFLPIAILASPAPMVEDADLDAPMEHGISLMKRTSCKVEIDLYPDRSGTCVDTRAEGACPKGQGIMVSGYCPGANYIKCCIPTLCGIGIP